LQRWHIELEKSPATNPLKQIAAAEITEFGLERTTCYGTCPAYMVVFAKDGTVRYEGGRYAARTNKWTGTISPARFADVAKFIADAGFADWETKYRKNITDHPTVFTMVAANGGRKVISNYAEAGPGKLQQVEQRLTELLAAVKWNEPTAKEEPAK